MATLKDIADEVGVTPSFVSKVLNGRMSTSTVTEETAERIHASARRLGYRKNTAALALREGRHHAIGVLIHPFGVAGSGVTDGIVQGIAGELSQRHQKQHLAFYDQDAEFDELVEGFHAGVVDGLLIAGIRHFEAVPKLLKLQSSGVPVVTVHDSGVHEDLPNVAIDQEQVGLLATRHLIEQGCRRIAHIGGYPGRSSGYRAALREAEIRVHKELIFDRHKEVGGGTPGADAVDALSARGVAFDGLFAASDQEAMQVLRALLAHGKRVPEDVRVIGVDNAPYCDLAVVPLSSVSQQDAERGRLAVRLLLDAIDGKPVSSTSVEPEVIARESTRG